MIFNVLTLFPEMFEGFLKTSIIGRSIENNKLQVNLINIRDFSKDKHKSVDDAPYGGGPGMVMTPQPLRDAIQSINVDSHIVFLTPKGQPLNQKKVIDLSNRENITLICGHYEGVDQRIIDTYVDEEISIGDYVLTGGELGAMVVVDSVTRLLPGVLGDEDSYKEDSHYNGLLDHPHYTRPQNFDGMEVPKVLLSGHHEKIEQWRLEQSIVNTYEKRSDLIDKKLVNDTNEGGLVTKIKNTLKKYL
jgi:tRNA (guanine37-N1)-methyltransferase